MPWSTRFSESAIADDNEERMLSSVEFEASSCTETCSIERF